MNENKFLPLGVSALPEKRMTVKEVVSLYRIPEISLKQMILDSLPMHGTGKNKYFLKSEVENWLTESNKMINDLQKGTIINNVSLSQIFKCSQQGGMRRSHKTNSLVLILKHKNGFYEDSWHGDILHYTGMGQTGDQTLEGNQNITLFDSDKNGVNVYLFESYIPNQYTYKGRVELNGKPYQTHEIDTNKKSRLVWKFPISVIN